MCTMKLKYFNSAVIAIILCVSKMTVTVDLTNDPTATGSFVVKAVTAKLGELFRNVHESIVWQPRYSFFMEILAYVETLDGQEAGEEGIWNPISSDINVNVQPQPQWISEVNTAFNINNYHLVELLDSRPEKQMIPIRSAIAARIILIQEANSIDHCRNFPSPNTNDTVMATFWITCYHRVPQSEQSMEFFFTRLREFRRREEAAQCSVSIDIAFVLDESGSIGQENWISVQSYLSNITTSIMGNERVAIITFSDTAMLHFSFNDNQDGLQQVVDTLPYNEGSTNTADGLCQLLDQEWRKDVLRIAIVMTDGHSNQVSPVCGNTASAITRVKDFRPSITFLVIAVGGGVNYAELEEIASSNELIYNLSTLGNEVEIQELQDQQFYEICFTASVPVDINNTISRENFTGTARFTISASESITIRVCPMAGEVVAYGSFKIRNPNRALHDFALDAFIYGPNTCQDLLIPSTVDAATSESRRKKRQAELERPIYLSVEGIAQSNSFTLETTYGDTTQNTVTCDDNPCGRNAQCVMEEIGFSCQCISGYKFEANLYSCLDINECITFPQSCSQFAVCSNTNGSFECNCISGYTGNGTKCNTATCDDNPCGRNAQCVTEEFGFSCQCISGYEFEANLYNCLDINECITFPQSCSQFAVCSNTNGSFECNCISGYTGNGTKCIINQSTELRFAVTVACGAVGGAVVVVVILAALIAIYKTMRAKKNSQYRQQDNGQCPADTIANLNVYDANDKDAID